MSIPLNSNIAMLMPVPKNIDDIRYAKVLIPKNRIKPVIIAIKGAYADDEIVIPDDAYLIK